MISAVVDRSNDCDECRCQPVEAADEGGDAGPRHAAPGGHVHNIERVECKPCKIVECTHTIVVLYKIDCTLNLLGVQASRQSYSAIYTPNEMYTP